MLSFLRAEDPEVLLGLGLGRRLTQPAGDAPVRAETVKGALLSAAGLLLSPLCETLIEDAVSQGGESRECVCVSVCLSVCLFVCLSVFLSVFLSACLSA